MESKIAVYAINLKTRPERRESILKEFDGLEEFSLKVVNAVRHKTGAFGLWESIKAILRNCSADDELIIVCEDDHQFTDAYCRERLLDAIHTARENKAEILLGGVSWFEDIVFVTDNLVRVKQFTGTQFVLIFRHSFGKILDAPFSEYDVPDRRICEIFDHIYMMYPFISIQKDLGYSDATAKNDVPGKVAELFERSSYTIETLKRVVDYYGGRRIQYCPGEDFDLTKLTIPTYIINLKDRPDRLAHVRAQFAGRPEFDISVIEAVKHKIGAVGLWMSIRKVVETAVANNDDVIVICEDDHEFTPAYAARSFLENVIIAQQLNVAYLSGGCSNFERALPVTPTLYWVAHCQATQFIVLYKAVFEKILLEPFDETVVADLQLSAMVSDKMVFNPGISTQKDFGYSDVTGAHNEHQGLVTNMFRQTKARLESLVQIAAAHNSFCLRRTNDV